jgi:hypothetical protein
MIMKFDARTAAALNALGFEIEDDFADNEWAIFSGYGREGGRLV